LLVVSLLAKFTDLIELAKPWDAWKAGGRSAYWGFWW
jgi:hypothetical protein